MYCGKKEEFTTFPMSWSKNSTKMKSQGNNYMPEVVPHVSRSYGKVFIFKLQWLQTTNLENYWKASV